MVALAAALNINSALSAVPFGAEVYDDGGWHSTSVNTHLFTVPAGVDRVKVGANVSISDSNVGTMYVAQIVKNGTVFVGRPAQASTTGPNAPAVGRGPRISLSSGEIPVQEGDTFQLAIYSDPGDASFDIDASKTDFWIESVPA